MKNNNSGQTLVIFLVYVLIAIIVTTASVAILVTNYKNTDKLYQGSNAYDVAESGAEIAILKLLRDPSYTGEEALTVDEGTATITITGTDPKIIVSKGKFNNFTKTLQVILNNNNGILTTVSWEQM
jgi:type II secretory pathway component PulK